MKKYLISSALLTLLTLVFFSGIYTCIVYAFTPIAPGKGKGVVIEDSGKRYFAVLGQSFTRDDYFWSRPSAANYNAAGSCGSNKGPSNPDYLKEVSARIDAFLVHNPGVKKSDIPSDLVTASGSGLDPHISPEAAYVQVVRISKVRNIPRQKIISLVDEHVSRPLLGTATVHVLKLNLALDKLK